MFEESKLDTLVRTKKVEWKIENSGSRKPLDLFSPDKFVAPGHDQGRCWVQFGGHWRRIECTYRGWAKAKFFFQFSDTVLHRKMRDVFLTEFSILQHEEYMVFLRKN